jgi:putative ABC transport system permease protein
VIGHLFRLVWNRRRANALILVEIFVSFLVLAALSTVCTWYIVNWTKPLGFDWKNVLRVDMRSGAGERDDEGQAFMATARRILAELRTFPEVESVAMAANLPYGNDTWSSSSWVDGRRTQYLHSPITIEGREVLRLQVVRGRWIEKGDEAVSFIPVLITENLAEGWFHGQDPIGKDVPNFDESGKLTAPTAERPIQRIVGVVRNYRRDGEPANTPYAIFLTANMQKTGFNSPESVIIRLQPGTPAAFEARLQARLQELAPDWSFRMEPISRYRDRTLKSWLVPLLIGGAVGLFLIFSVGLGLIGVLWQSVTRRTSEIGVRHAMGASPGHIVLQIVGEMLALTSFAILAGVILFLQVPILGFFSFIPQATFGFGIALAALVLYLFVTFCGLYPGWLAARVQPAEALQHE